MLKFIDRIINNNRFERNLERNFVLYCTGQGMGVCMLPGYKYKVRHVYAWPRQLLLPINASIYIPKPRFVTCGQHGIEPKL